MVLYTEHELNASTFSARVTVSTLSDIYSGIVAAIGTLKGPLHGGANEEAWKVLEQVGAPENAEQWIQDALARKERIMGFGHRVYKTGDPSCPRSSRSIASHWRRKWVTTAGSGCGADRAGGDGRRSTCHPTWIGPARGSTITWAWRPTSIRRSSPWPGLSAGPLTSSSNSTTTADAPSGALYGPAAPSGQANRAVGEPITRRIDRR